METIETSNVIKAYKEADVKGKELIKTLFPKVNFESANVLDRVFTWEDVCQEVGEDPIATLPFSTPKNDRQEGANAFYRLALVREVLNAGKDADWANPNETKYILWPDVVVDPSKPSGFGLSYCGCAYSLTFTRVGSRLTFKDKATAKHAFTHFKTDFEKLFLITKNK